MTLAILVFMGAIAEHRQLRRMMKDLTIKVENTPTRVALAQNRNEPENIPFEAKTFAIRQNLCFFGYFRSAVQ
jgi:hypothetical protein